MALVTEQINTPNGSFGLSARVTGIVYLLISSVCFSFAGVFVKGVDTGSWGVIVWRGGFGLLFLIIFFAPSASFPIR